MSLQTLHRKLNSGPSAFFNIYAIFAGFITYFAMYGFRKPFSVGRFDETISFLGLFDLDLKILFVFSQVIGYTISKFMGIKIVSEALRSKRIVMILTFILIAESALIMFPLLPRSYQALALLLNGLPLGMIWGLVFSFLEGRRSTELLAAGLSTSYIVASGAVKSVGKWVLLQGISEYWMPAITGLIFFPMLCFGLWMLSQIPDPNQDDETLRTKRAPMDAAARKQFFLLYAPGLMALTLFYMLLTAYRDIRDNFSREIFDELGYQDSSLIFTSSEVPIAFLVMLSLAAIMYIKNNRKAVTAIHGLLVGGSALIGLITLAFQLDLISPIVWMIGIGLGLYLGYVPFGSVIFDRIIAETRFVGTAAFMIYVTDAFGYLGSVSIMFYKNFSGQEITWLQFFTQFSYVTSIACTLGFGYSMLYFYRQHQKPPTGGESKLI
ncbi:DUF5690 family protein [Pseudobacteriovorax antillogorgiicola]|uniref:Sugar phosphate permease n=1 Tax=Pseudobacteriovorax antillogorgiicola TaxID=1513793 RepID=A0A1Y6CAN1_9BACT|nr:DUF5690 family protein [Pseudobacteriovorax antillogorgiicola]TCS49071.1 hypothetical protein EDD56_116114 [Pseudobacteriovorax antillogorgiicola]SMF52209.1 hypothetical protein SAMN06296036_11640 [Pseudobacteriovorax antillogorgiicola]